MEYSAREVCIFNGTEQWLAYIHINQPQTSGWEANTAKITVNVWDFGPLRTAITPLQRGGFPTIAATLNSFIDIIHSTEKEATTSVNSNYKSSHVASNFMVICMIMLIRRVCMKSFTVDESLLYTSRK